MGRHTKQQLCEKSSNFMNDNESKLLNILGKPNFNKDDIDKELLASGFAYYDDWEYGHQIGWSINHDHFTMRLFPHSFGYWVTIEAHMGGANKRLNMGSSNKAEDIIAVKKALDRLF